MKIRIVREGEDDIETTLEDLAAEDDGIRDVQDAVRRDLELDGVYEESGGASAAFRLERV